jgi:DUF1009 family protein
VEKLSLVENKDIKFGRKIAKGIAGFDIGQTVIVKDKSVLAVESVGRGYERMWQACV